MKLEELNPFIRYASMHRAYYPNKENSICYDCRLFFIVRGSGFLFANGQNFKVADNLAVFLPPKTQYRFVFDNCDGVEIYVLDFDLTDKFSFIPKSLGTATESTYNPRNVPDYELPQAFSNPIIQENGVSVRNYVSDCARLFLQKVAYYEQYASAYLKLALIELLCGTHNGKSGYKLIQDIQNYIRDNYADAELNNVKIAERFNYHPYHINRLMKIYTKRTLHEYITDYRLHIAKHCLLTTTLNVTAVAEKTGFSSYTYFIKIFRERIGLSPLQYRKRNKNAGF